MSAYNAANVETIDLTMDDELDVMLVSSPVVPKPPRPFADRALRARLSVGNTVGVRVPSLGEKRTRRLSDSTVENHELKVPGKKLKMEDKKAVINFPLASAHVVVF